MLGMVPGECSDTVRTQEFTLVEHARQNSTQPFGIHEGCYTSVGIPQMSLAGCMNALTQLWHMPQARPHNVRHPWYQIALPRLDYGCGTEGQQAHNGADLEPSCATIGKTQNVVIETVLLVPHTT